ncbi:MAG: gamma-glutamyltranspeptidase/glutathione hydrolase [Pseudohongiellaceae bacterium]|jgi:gamma-glutamyltranspeptidase/glutathione hydrolase
MKPISAVFFASVLPMLVACSDQLDVATQQATETEIPAFAEADGVQSAVSIPVDSMRSDIRPEVGGMRAAVVSEHPLASQIGYEVLRNGGNATDAVVSMAAALAVVRPHMNSVGGDSFALFYDAKTGEVTAMNASGRAGTLATPEFYSAQDLTRMPFSGALSITVPGTVSAWEAALERFGSLTMAQALAPAIDIAEKGFMVTSTFAADAKGSAPEMNDAGRAIYYPGDQPLKEGDLLKSVDLAMSLRMIAEQGAAAMYGGELGNTIAAFLEAQGSPIRLQDFDAHHVEWGTPASVQFQGRTVHTVKPNSQGIVLLQMLSMIETLPLADRSNNSAQLLHEMIEVTKLAFADRDRWIADLAMADVPVAKLLNEQYLNGRAGQLSASVAAQYSPGFESTSFDDVGEGPAEDGDTIFAMVVDEEGNAVSWIQSLYGSFGSKLVVPGTGIVLQNRGAGFSLQEGHPNQVAPGKRPFHTLMSTMITDANGEFEMAIGTPGGSGQPQFISQALLKTLVFGMSPQQAVESPRFRIGNVNGVSLESRLPQAVRAGLSARGHDVEVVEGWTANFGSVQVIQRLASGMLRTGADMRREAAAMAY